MSPPTEAKSPREIAQEIYDRATRGEDDWPNITVDRIERAILSYAAERERLLAEADAVIVRVHGDRSVDFHDAVRWREAAITRHKSRLSSRPR